MKAEQVSEARAVFDAALAGESDPERIAKIELLREYFTNADFRKALEDHVWALTQKCCGDAACYNMSSGVPCSAFKTTAKTKAATDEAVLWSRDIHEQ